MPDRRVIVVGIDELGADRKALRWALDRATTGGYRLRLVHAYECSTARSWTPRLPAYPVEVADEGRALDQRLVDTAAAECRRLAPGLPVEAMVLEGPAAKVLLAQSDVAVTVVLGSGRLGRIASYVLGSTGRSLVQHARCPVVVIRHDPGGRSVRKIVVGLDLDHDSDLLLDYAFELAAQRGLPVEAVTCWPPPIGRGLEWATGYEDEDRARIELALCDRIAPWQEKYPGVEASTTVSARSPVPGLLERAGDLNPLVLGRRGRHPGVSSLGSVHLGALHQANCPIVVVPTGPHL